MSAQPSVITKFPPAALPKRNVGALDLLLRAFRECRPTAVVLGSGYKFAPVLIDELTKRVAADVDIVRLTDPKPDPLRCMQKIVQSIGFCTDGLDLSDLQQILSMFLAYQRTHQRRTILYVESAHEASAWTLDTLDQLVARETRRKDGLFVLLAGDRSLEQVLRKPGFPALQSNTDFRIKLSAFEIGETREHIYRFVEADGRGDISEIFEYDAITRMHDISEGVPDTINQLIDECLKNSPETPISPTLVEHAAAHLRLPYVTDEFALLCDTAASSGWLEVRLGDELVDRHAFDREQLIIGRSARCNIRLYAPTISREHAMMLKLQGNLKIVDLGSTNGTFVNGRRIDNFQLDGPATIRVGDYAIAYSPESH